MSRRRFRVLVPAAFILCLVFAPAAADPGDTDSTFGPGGVRHTDFDGENDGANDVAVQKNGKIVAVGYSYRPSVNDFALARYKPGGEFDGAFGEDGNGEVTTSLTNGGDVAKGVAIQPDGKIVIVGSADSGAYTDFGMARYNRDGTLDATFSNDGKRVTHLSDFHDNASDVVVQKDGKIVVAGLAALEVDPFGDQFAVVRYRRGGGLDKTFGDEGVRRIDFGGNFDQARGIVLQPDGKILVTGRGQGKVDETDFAVARLRTNGKLDKTFSKDGRQTADSGLLGADVPDSVAVQEGKVIVSGTVHANPGDDTDEDFAAVRFKTAGALDKDFGDDGWALASITVNDSHEDMVIQPDNKIIMVGSDDFFGDDFAAIRLKENGGLDPTWGTGGIVTTALTGGGTAMGAAIGPDEKLVVAGNSYNGSGPLDDFTLVRYKTGL